MKKVLYITMLIIFSSLNIYAQKDKFSFSFGYGVNTYSMGNINEFYIDSFAAKPNVNMLNDNIKKGSQYQFSLSYQPNRHFDVGLYGSYQYGNSKSKPLMVETDNWGFPVKEHKGTYELRTEAISAGISATWYIDGLLNWHEKETTLNRFHFGVEVNGGVGFSRVVLDMRYPTFPAVSSYDYFTSRDFQGQFGVKVEYDFTKSPIYTTLGIRLGYQYFKTQTVKGRLGEEWVALGKYPINLDFSGFYFGVYLKIGK
ncbi:MAG: hypothetical protein H3C31_11025 [Brumimicrobium sp.]|nr:hypothetical protein [Brumimicrobium sp.]